MKTLRKDEFAVMTPSPPVQTRKFRPVKWWAAAGVASLCLWAYSWSRWILAGNFETTPNGSSQISDLMMFALRANEVGFSAAFVFGLWFFVIRPWRRQGSLQTDGMLYIGFMAMYWQDPLSNLFRPSFVYNTGLYQWGGWANFVPGFNAPNGQHYSEPLFFAFTVYAIFMLAPMCWACAVMRKARARWPAMGNLGLMGVAFGFLLVLDCIVEISWLRTGAYMYPGPIKQLTLFHGHFYQFPVYEGAIFSICWALYVALRWYKNDKGETIAERGIEDVRASPRQKTGLRLLAVIGVINVIYFFSYNLPMAITTLYGHDWPKDVVERTYFTNNYCPEEAGYSCPSRHERIPTRSTEAPVKYR